MQVSQSEPAVRHALAAVGALNERRDLCLRIVTYNNAVVVTDPKEASLTIHNGQDQHNDPFALSQYNKAITHLAKAMASPSSNSVDTALLVCILFVCVECLRGDYQPALKHFKGGMQIALAAAGRAGPNSRGAQTTAIREKLLPFFNRLELLGQVFGERPEYPYGLEPYETVPASFNSIIEARDSIVHLMNLAIRLIHSLKVRRHSHAITPTDILHHSQITKALHDWKSRLDYYLLTSSSNPSPRLREAATILEIQQNATLTWLNRSLADEELATDYDMHLYEHAVTLAESLPPPTSPQTFLFDMEIVSPLYLVALKCRDPIIRRRAIAVLRRHVRREGLWDSLKAAAIAERIVAIEEQGLESLDGTELPKEEQRVTNANIDSGPGMNPSWHKITLAKRPKGVERGWCVWEEWVELRP